MSGGKNPRPRRSLALSYGRLAEGLTQKELSERSGVPDLSTLEKHREPERQKVEELFAAMGRRLPEEVDVALFCADLMRRPEPVADSPVEPTLDEARTLTAAAALEAGAVFHRRSAPLPGRSRAGEGHGRADAEARRLPAQSAA